MQRPSALGLFLCQEVVRHDDGRRTIVAMFDGLTGNAFPLTASPFTVYAALTDGQGQVKLDLMGADLADEEQLAMGSMLVDFPSPLEIVHARFRFRGLTFPTPGHYLFELSVEGEPICHRRLRVESSED